MKIHQVLCFVAVCLLSGCSSLRQSMQSTGISLQEVAIQNAILDFSTNCSLFKKDSIFFVNFHDSVFYGGYYIRVDEKAYKDRRTHTWIRGAFVNGIVMVEIIEFYDSFYYSTKEKETILPSRYAIKDGKLFYWWDDNYPLTEELIVVLRKYNLLQTHFPEGSMNIVQKEARYYFCKNNLSRYKRVIKGMGMKKYNPPKLKCND